MPSVRALPAVLLAILASAAAGCGLTTDQRAAVERFGLTTLAIADLASDTLIQARTDVVALRTVMLELGAPSVDLRDPANDLDSSLNLEDLEARLRTASKLREYAALLLSLVNDDSGARIKAAADSFLDQIDRSTRVKLDVDRKMALSALLSEVTGWWIDCKKRRALKEIVPSTRPVVDKLIELWRDDFDPASVSWISSLSNTEKEIQGSLRNMLWNLKPGDAVPGRNQPRTAEEISRLHARLDALRADAARHSHGLNLLCLKIHEALRELLEANKELEDKVRYDDYSIERIGLYVDKVRECRNLVQALRGK